MPRHYYSLALNLRQLCLIQGIRHLSNYHAYLDGRVSAVVGTHTHVQTADERVLPGGTAFISDVGMSGARDSVIGIRKELSIQRFLTQMPVRYEIAKKDPVLCAVVVSIDESTGKATGIERVQVASEGMAR